MRGLSGGGDRGLGSGGESALGAGGDRGLGGGGGASEACWRRPSEEGRSGRRSHLQDAGAAAAAATARVRKRKDLEKF